MQATSIDIFLSPITNNSNYFGQTLYEFLSIVGADTVFSCAEWTSPQHLLFQLANGCFFVSYIAPSQNKGLLFMHCILILGKLIATTLYTTRYSFITY